MVASFWDKRLSIACVATDAEDQNRIILHDNTLNLPVVARQPHPVQQAGQASGCMELRAPNLETTTRQG